MQHGGFLFFTLALGLGGCAEDLRGEMNTQPDLGGTSATGKVKLTQESSDVRRLEVNATAMDQWVYLRLDTGAEVAVQDAAASREWDLGIKRYYLKINGGVSGGCGSEVAVQSGTEFSALARAPMAGYVTDQPDSSDEDPEPDYALSQSGGWYDYNVMTHALTPRSQFYILKTCTGGYVKLQMTGYYDSAGTSGFPGFRVAPVAAP
jgi:hypothetical protein